MSLLYSVLPGDTRALLVRTDVDGIMSVTQLTVDHTIESEQEQQRLAKLGLDVEKRFQLKKIGTSDCTRCIGDFHAKGGYKDIDVLRCVYSTSTLLFFFSFYSCAWRQSQVTHSCL